MNIFFARGRPAWIAAIILGVILLIVGIVKSATFFIITGIGFAVFGIIFLIISLVTKGASD